MMSSSSYSRALLLFACLIILGAAISTAKKKNAPKCSIAPDYKGVVLNVSDGTYDRCASVVLPKSSSVSSSSAGLPFLFFYHGAGGSGAFCGGGEQDDFGLSLGDYANKYGFALVCGEAVQDIFGNGGEWNIPEVMTNATGTPCKESDSVEIAYLKNVIAALGSGAAGAEIDTSRILSSGCSMGSAFSEYSSACLHELYGSQRVPAFATHSTGLKIKGDGNHFPPDNYNTSTTWGECPLCEYFPVVPKAHGPKACLNDNKQDPSPDDPFFYRSTVQMAKVYGGLAGNRVETYYGSGHHCQIHSYWDIANCLDDGTGWLTQNKSKPACQKATAKACAAAKSSGGEAGCKACLRKNFGPLSGPCMAWGPFPELVQWYCSSNP
eukprot:g1211.t1